MQTTRHERPGDRYRHITHLFPIFLGLRMVPIGIWFLTAAIPALGLFPSTAHQILLLFAIAGVWWTHRWYRDRYGRVEPARLSLGRNWAILLGWLLASLALSLGGSIVGLRPMVLGVVLILLATAALFALPRISSGGRGAVGAFFALAILAGLVLILSTRDPADLGAAGGLFSVSVGVLLCLAGVVEHRSLTRVFAGLRAASSEESGVGLDG